jgi:predicted nucleotidyltransferase component of viral defense system
MNNWLRLKQDQQQNVFNQASDTTGLPPYSIEKDAWVTLVLRMLFTSILSDHIVFKGGTSLSKGYNLIERFSEDIDLAIDREYFGFEGDLTKGEIRKLRRRSHDFSLNVVPEILKKQFEKNSINPDLFDITVPNIKISDQDPEVVHVNYKTVFNGEYYLPNRVLIEIGARSLNDPSEERNIGSIIDENFKDVPFVEKPFLCRTIIPEKTFLEKLFLLHEEFHKPVEKVRDQRMSRHLYDIYKISQTEYGKRALKDSSLFNIICKHRASFTPVPGIAYNDLTLNDLNFIPPGEIMEQYRSDYLEMQRSMIYGISPAFDELIEHLRNLLNHQ